MGVIAICGILGSHSAIATEEPITVSIPGLMTYSAMKTHLLEATNIPDPEARGSALDALWDHLQVQQEFPFVRADSVAFLYRGEANSVAFTGDFDGWEPKPGRAHRLGESNVWLQEEIFPQDARLDYKIVINGSTWLLDPENPRTQKGGFGDNSELRMPKYRPSPWVTREPDIPHGSLTQASLKSLSLGYMVNYITYTPAGYAELDNLPVIYVTDGHEYADDAMGSMVIILDNLIGQHLIRPMMAVFIDPRVEGQNLRAEQYILNEKFVRFVVEELVPVVDTNYRTSRDRQDRGILGTSLGGLNSAWFALRATDTFGRIGIQSPAFQVGEGTIYGLYEASPKLDIDIFITWGTMHDTAQAAGLFQSILITKGYQYHHLIVNEGHSWGAWRAQLDDILIAFWPSN